MPIIITSHSHSLSILNSNFTRNLGTHGVLYFDFSSQATGRALISNSSFIHNTGIIKSSALYLVGRYLPNQDNQNFCTPFTLLNNIFSRNFLLPSDNALITLECRLDSTTSNPFYLDSTLQPSLVTYYSHISRSSPLSTAQIQGNLFFENVRLKFCNLIQLLSPLYLEVKDNHFERNFYFDALSLAR